MLARHQRPWTRFIACALEPSALSSRKTSYQKGFKSGSSHEKLHVARGPAARGHYVGKDKEDVHPSLDVFGKD